MMRLTPGEALWLLRRRVGYTMPKMAKARRISEDRLRDLEKDRVPLDWIPKMNGRPITPGEWCAIQRKRRGWTMPQAARRLKISRMTLWKAEHDRTSGVHDIMRYYKDLAPVVPAGAVIPIKDSP